jgi:hypothetical protein
MTVSTIARRHVPTLAHTVWATVISALLCVSLTPAKDNPPPPRILASSPGTGAQGKQKETLLRPNNSPSVTQTGQGSGPFNLGHTVTPEQLKPASAKASAKAPTELSPLKPANPFAQKETAIGRNGRGGSIQDNFTPPPVAHHAPANPFLADEAPPTPVADDPPGGIPVTGGTVHRGTGTYEAGPDDKRTTVVCWVEVDPNAKCTNFRWYQWVCTVITSIDYNDGKGPNLNPPLAVKDVAILTATGGYLRINNWSADDHASTRNKTLKPMFKGQNTPCAEPKMPLKAGAYAGPSDIPGQPKPKNEEEKLRRLIDAPNGEAAADGIMRKAFLKGRGPVNRKEPPPAGTPITLEITYYFRVAEYCDDNCLGTFEWKLVEKLTVTPTWIPRKDEVNVGGDTIYDLRFIGKRVGNPTPTFGPWKAPPC